LLRGLIGLEIKFQSRKCYFFREEKPLEKRIEAA
jgi:hypothetical protein